MTATLPRSLGPSLAALLFVLLLINESLSPDPLTLSHTSHGQHLYGHGAVYDLLSELELSAGRTRRRPQADGDASSTRWLVSPNFLEELGQQTPEWSHGGEDGDADALLAWVEAGGTAIVFGASHSNWQRLGLELLVDRAALHDDASDSDVDVDGDADADAVVNDDDDPGDAEPVSAVDDPQRWYDILGHLRSAIPHTLTPGGDWPRRMLQLHRPVRFQSVADTDIRVHYRLDDAPFVVEKRIGAGRILAVADARLLQNATLDLADHSVLAVDLARRYGRATFDERCHGLTPAGGLWGAMGTGPGLCLLIGLCSLGLVGLLLLRAEPARTLLEHTPHQPRLDAYARDLSQAYAQRGLRDVGAAFEAYRAGLRQRLRRFLFGRGRGDEAMLSRRIERDARASAGLRATLEGRRRPRDQAELIALARELEGYAARVIEPAQPPE